MVPINTGQVLDDFRVHVLSASRFGEDATRDKL